MRRISSLIALCMMFAVPGAMAQFSSSVLGTILDTNGAAVTNAKVSLVNIDTNVTVDRTADAMGAYRFASIAPGNYQVSASAPGFNTVKVTVKLQTTENRDVPITLAVAQVASTVSVTAAAPLLDTSDSRSQLTIDNESIQSLPLAARNPTSLISLTPGVSGLGSAGYTNFFTENADFSANGRGNNGNQYVLDGLDINIDVNP